MPKKNSTPFEDTGPRSKAKTQEGRESQLIALAYDAVEKRILEGTASSQELVHFLKMGSSRERREADLDEAKLDVLVTKAEMMESMKRIEDMYKEAINAVTSYRSPASLGPVEDRHD